MKAVATTQGLALTGGERAVGLPDTRWPIIGETDERWMMEVLRSGKWNWLGEHEREFCRAYAEFIGTRFCLCLSNGTVALQCALQAVGVEPGHEVIVPALTWVATAQAAMDVGADVILVDVDPETLCIDPEAVRQAITPRAKAILPVHLYGCMCDMDALMEIAREHDLKVVEDVAHQHGSQWRGVAAGAIGDAGAFSFEQSKVLTSGEGGAITCDDAEVYETAFALKAVGWAPADIDADPLGEKGLQRAGRYGHNYRITEMQACLLRGGLTRLAEQTARREENARYLAEALSAMGGPLRVARRDPRVTRQAYYCLTLHVDPEQLAGLTREQYLSALHAEWIPFSGTYEPVYRAGLLNLYDRTSPIPFRNRNTVQDYASLHLPNTERAVTQTAVTLSQVQLLAGREYLDQILRGIEKVNRNLGEVKRHFEMQRDS